MTSEQAQQLRKDDSVVWANSSGVMRPKGTKGVVTWTSLSELTIKWDDGDEFGYDILDVTEAMAHVEKL